jgi:CheY-like chemotaxis protein
MGEDRIRGLIVDDEPAARLEIRECAEVLGYDFIEAASVEEAREVLRRERVDFVVLDLSIPYKKGRPDKIEYGKVLLDEILQKHHGVGIVVVTAHESYYHAVDVMQRSSAVSFVPKPFDDTPDNPSLTRQIRHVLAKCNPGRLKQTRLESMKGEPTRTENLPTAEIDISSLGRYRNKGHYCLVNGEKKRFSYEQHKILKAFAVAQSSIPDDSERHRTVVDADEFRITNDHANRHSMLTRLRDRLQEYLGMDRTLFLVNEADRKYSLGCYCIDSTPGAQAKATERADGKPKPPPAELMD